MYLIQERPEMDDFEREKTLVVKEKYSLISEKNCIFWGGNFINTILERTFIQTRSYNTKKLFYKKGFQSLVTF